MNDESIRRDLARREYLENNRQPEHTGGTGPSWRDAAPRPICPECGSRVSWKQVCYSRDGTYECMDCDVEYAAEEVE